MKNKIITLNSNQLSIFGQETYAKVKYFKAVKSEKKENYVLKFLEKMNLRKMSQLIYSNLETNCYCDFDCCGHVFSRAIDIKRVGKNKVSFSLIYERNF